MDERYTGPVQKETAEIVTIVFVEQYGEREKFRKICTLRRDVLDLMNYLARAKKVLIEQCQESAFKRLIKDKSEE